MFFRTPFPLPILYPDLTWRMPGDEKSIYLTFDDGPVPGPTEFVLEQLKKYNARATFFCIGDNVRKYPLIFEKLKTSGHAIGNHTYHHVKGWSVPSDQYVTEVQQCDEMLQMHPAPGRRTLFRPPYGRITRAQVRALTNYQIVMWDVLTYDYSQRLSEEKCLAGSLRAVRPGSIVVLHDSLKAEKNMTYALPRLLEHFANLGYSFKSL